MIGDHSFQYVHKIFRKTNITYVYAYQRVRNVSFSENFANLLNDLALRYMIILVDYLIFAIFILEIPRQITPSPMLPFPFQHKVEENQGLDSSMDFVVKFLITKDFRDTMSVHGELIKQIINVRFLEKVELKRWVFLCKSGL